MNIKDQIKLLPLSAGIYLMKDSGGKVIYVGKAVSLRKRVGSYFSRSRATLSAAKTSVLVSRVDKIEHIETTSEAEALIMEASLIKKYKPKFNVDLKDDKTYPYIKVTGAEIPAVSIVRPRVKRKGCKYYGPYVNAKLIREALTIIRKIFHFRTCNFLPGKECLDYHLGLCDAPCTGKITKKDYAKIIKNVCLILEGKKDVLYRRLREEMEYLSRRQKFEEAVKVRDQLRAIGALYSGTKDINYFKEAEQLQRAFGLPHMPERIEAFDISNIMGQQAVGAMACFVNGKPDKKNYRKFRIKEVTGINDFEMIAEVVRRRYRRLRDEGLPFPDLILIDGGKGQLSAANRQLEKLDAQIPVISIAKKQEEVFLPKKRSPVLLQRNSLGLKFLQRIRDEAHRFAISYHRKLRAGEVSFKTRKDRE